MPHQIKKIVNDLQKAINILESEIDDNLLKAERGIKITKEAIEQLKAVIINKDFHNATDEITFFKFTKPQLYSKLFDKL